MTNKNTHHNQRHAFSRQSDTTIEQLLPTSGLVATAHHTASGGVACMSRTSSLDAACGISRALARQTAKPTGEWGRGRPTHMRLSQSNGHESSHQRQAVTLVQFDSRYRKESRPKHIRPDIGSHAFTSGNTNGRGDKPIDPDKSRKPFTHARRPPRGVRQDKGVLTNAASASVQPALHTKGVRAEYQKTEVVRSQSANATKQKSGRLSLWGIDPAVMSELVRVAAEEGLSLSQIGKIALGEWVHQRLHDKHEALLYPVLRQLFREELRSFGNRIIFFLMRIAFAAEQSRILITNVLYKIFIHMGLPIDKFNSLVDQSNQTAKRNIIARSPEIKTLMKEWQASAPHDTENTDNTSKNKRKGKI